MDPRRNRKKSVPRDIFEEVDRGLASDGLCDSFRKVDFFNRMFWMIPDYLFLKLCL